jgi:hypothetical protein
MITCVCCHMLGTAPFPQLMRLDLMLQDAEIANISDEIARFQAYRSSSATATSNLTSNTSLLQDPLARCGRLPALAAAGLSSCVFRLTSTLDFFERSAGKHEHAGSSLQYARVSNDGESASPWMHAMNCLFLLLSYAGAAPLLGSYPRRSQTVVLNHRTSATDVALLNSASEAAAAIAPSSSVWTSYAHATISPIFICKFCL